MARITEKLVEEAERFLVAKGHSMAAIAHPDDSGRSLAAIALDLGFPLPLAKGTADVIVGVLAYKHSGGKVVTPEVQAAGF